MNATLVLAPRVCFDELAEAAARLGWRRDPDPAAPEPITPGEPELASWSRAAGRNGRLITGYEPAVALRSVEVSGPNAGRWSRDLAAAVPTLSRADVERLLADEDVLLRGVIAARELRDPALRARLRELTAHPDETIAREAGLALRALAPVALNEWPPNAELRAAAALLTALESPARRQFVRLLGSLPEETRETLARSRGGGAGVVAVLAAALADRDWETRVSAMLAAARVGASVLIPPIRSAELPPAGRAGVEYEDRMLLVAAREIVIAELAGRDDRVLLDSHLGRCVTGRPVDRHDDIVLTVLALTMPLPETRSQPPETREGFVFVPPLAHWLGQDDRPGAVPNRPRRVTPPNGGFLISARPGPAIELAEARALADKLPTADEWEMAARGPDARRYPWGNGVDRRSLAAASPWGAFEFVGHGEWALADGTPVAVGTAARCGTRCHPQPGMRLAVREVVRLAG